MSGICREAGGAWADGEPCGMDAAPGQRCDWHTPGIETALSVAIQTGMVNPEEGRLIGDPVGCSWKLAEAAIARIVAVEAEPVNDAELARLLALIAEHYRHLWASWDLVSVPGTDESIARFDEHRVHLRRLREEMGPRLTRACFRAAFELYRDTPGKRSPLHLQRHVETCDQPRDEQGRMTCDCPRLFDWEIEEP